MKNVIFMEGEKGFSVSKEAVMNIFILVLILILTNLIFFFFWPDRAGETGMSLFYLFIQRNW